MFRFSCQIQLGAAAASPVPESIAKVYSALELDLLGTDSAELASDSFPISQPQVFHEAVKIMTRLQERIGQAQDKSRREGRPIQLYIFDLSGAHYLDCRESFLVTLARAIAWAREREPVGEYLLLLPSLPLPENPFYQFLEEFSMLLQRPEYTIRVIANNGEGRVFRHRRGEPKSDPISRFTASPGYVDTVGLLHADLPTRLAQKCVRTLGHFHASPRPNARTVCRLYSYHLHDCEEDIQELYGDWWREVVGRKARCVLYDLRHNSALLEAVLADASRRDVKIERIADVLSDRKLSKRIASAGPAVIVLDAVENGTHLLSHREKLRELGIELSSLVFTGIDKTEGRIGDENLVIRGVVERAPEPVIESCVQCQLGLPHGIDGSDHARGIRAYDMHAMLATAGWKAERIQEVPDEVGYGYTQQPNFPRLLEEYGDWLAFKLARQLKLQNGNSWAVIHADDVEASALMRRIQDCCGRGLITPVQIPRNDIRIAHSANGDWNAVLDVAQPPSWARLLPRGPDVQAVIVDVFNGSNHTATTLAALARHSHLHLAAYGCLVDFKPEPGTQTIAGVPKISLYQWHAPRRLKEARHGN